MIGGGGGDGGVNVVRWGSHAESFIEEKARETICDLPGVLGAGRGKVCYE